MSEGASPFEAWRRQYRSARYLEHASEVELLERAHKVLQNVLAMLDLYHFEGVGVNPAEEDWIRVLTELRLEFALRGRHFPPSRSLVREARWISNFSSALRTTEAAIRGYPRAARPIFVRYLRREHARAFALDGILRLAPASSYKDLTLNTARRDDEIVRWLQNGPLGVRLVHALSGRTTSFTQTIGYGAACETDYYFVSTSQTLNPRLFSALGVDACVIIREPEQFAAALEAALPEQLGGRWRLTIRNVRYVDPWPPDPPGAAPPSAGDLCFIKDYSFAYQQEVRVALVPEGLLQRPLSPIIVQLSKPSAFCDLLVLPEHNA